MVSWIFLLNEAAIGVFQVSKTKRYKTKTVPRAKFLRVE